VTEVAAPDLAPIIQNGFPFDQSVLDTCASTASRCARRRRHADPRLHPLPAGGADAAADPRPRRPPRHRRHAIAAKAQRILESRALESATSGEGAYRFLCTGDVFSFRELGTRFLQMPLGDIEGV
jgi:hypothetical protein